MEAFCYNKWKMLERFKGTLLAGACADALGMPVEGWLHDRIRLFYGRIENMIDGRLPAGSWTDDTQMTIAVATSIIEEGEVNESSLVNNFLKYYEPKRGYGYGTKTVLSHLRKGMKVEEATSSLFGEGSFGNGAAMRIAPVALFYFDDIQKLKEAAISVSKITHTHPLATEGAVLLAFAIAKALTSSFEKIHPIQFLKDIISFTKEEIFYQKLSIAENLLKKDAEKEEVIEKLGCGVSAQDSVPTAIFCFLKFFHSLKEATLYAVNLGGDADTIASMCANISGALHGVEAIPKEWLEKLEKREYIEELAQRLFDKKFKR